MRSGVIAQKLGMTRIFTDAGEHVPVTVLRLANCQVVGHRTKEKNGYVALQLGSGTRKAKTLTRAELSTAFWRGTLGYSANLKHGVTGKGLNDYDTIFSILAQHDYRGWVSIEDGMNGMDEMAESLAFLRKMSATYFPEP